ncbi:unnamed protein product [Onchocerca ochengi]|uniref:GLOBIN domain-containing protein n=2 Tax=Onchocerca TaxID=6281 RepID=A0A182E815_ONCOC|nr:unnamed protein product [Onchocerca ochengi]
MIDSSMYRSLYWAKIEDDLIDVQQLDDLNDVQQLDDLNDVQQLSANQRKQSDFSLMQVKKFSFEDRQILYDTFKLFEKDLTSNGLRIFLKTLSENPEYKYFWPQFRAIPDSSLISSCVLRNFAGTYMNALKEIVEGLNNEQMPKKVLRRISIKHAAHNIQMHHIKKMIRPLIENVRGVLGRRDENAERAWETLFHTIGSITEHYKSIKI